MSANADAAIALNYRPGMRARLIALAVGLGCGCGGEGEKTKPADKPYVSKDPPVVAYEDTPKKSDAGPDAIPDATTEPDASQHELKQQEIVDALNTLFRSGGVDANAGASEEDLMIVSSTKCDRKVLTDLRKALVAFKLDPAKAFETMQCNGGPVLKLR
jgi:hypothetical protein